MRVRFLLLLLPLSLVVVGCGHDQDPNPPAPGDEAQLDPPAMGAGVQVQSDDTVVPAGVEEQDCYFFKVSDLEQQFGMDPTKKLDVHEVQIAQREGTHHMNIFRVRTIVNLDPKNGTEKDQNGVGECFKSSNWADWPLLANSQDSGLQDWSYPDGVANEIDPDEVLMLQTHYVNASTQETPYGAKVRVNLVAMNDADVKYELGTLFATNQSIRVCQSDPTPHYRATCQIKGGEGVHVVGANGHFHSRGTKFQMFAWDGKTMGEPSQSSKFYESDTWNEPPMLHSPELDQAIPANGGVVYTCDYQWQEPPPAIGCSSLDAYDEMKWMTPADELDCCYTFGPIVDKNEHCNAFVYYYPKQDDVNCF